MAKRKGPRSVTNPVSLAALRRRQFVLQLRIAGAHYRDIAQSAIEEFGVSKLPNGWDERYAYKDLMRLLEHTNSEMLEGREHIRQLELERLDVLMMGIWESALDGDKDSVSSVLNIMGRRAKITGIDAPIEYTFDDIQSIARKVVNVVSTEVKDENVQERIFSALGF